MRVLIVDDSEPIRRILRRTIETKTTFTIVGKACNGADAVDAMEQLQPDVIVMDINMPVMDGVEAARLIKSAFPAVHIVVCTSNNSNEVSDLLHEGVIVGQVYKTATNDLVDHDQFGGPGPGCLLELLLHQAQSRGTGGALEHPGQQLSPEEPEEPSEEDLPCHVRTR